MVKKVDRHSAVDVLSLIRVGMSPVTEEEAQEAWGEIGRLHGEIVKVFLTHSLGGKYGLHRVERSSAVIAEDIWTVIPCQRVIDGFIGRYSLVHASVQKYSEAYRKLVSLADHKPLAEHERNLLLHDCLGAIAARKGKKR